MAKLEHDMGVHSGCGVHTDLIEADDLMLSPKDRVCPLCAAKDRYERILIAADEKAAKAAGELLPADPRPSDGRHFYIDMKPIPPGG